MAITAVVCLSLTQFSCEKRFAGKVYNCQNRVIHPDRTASKGVDKDPVVVCGGSSVSWKEKNGEKWQVDFVTSPFQQGEKTIKNGQTPSPVLVLTDDTAFKYTITVDDKSYDPQIIIMGGN
jgi:hypothetical protein